MNRAHAAARRSLWPALIAALALALALPALAGAHGKKNDRGAKHGAVAKSKAQKSKGKKGGHHKGKKGHHGKGKVVTTMTRNLYLGANLTPAIGAPSVEALVAATGQILREVTANSFPTRAKGLAAEIRATQPDLIGLQEVALWRTAPPSLEPLQTGPSATTVRYDYLAELVAAVNAGKGPGYEVVAVQNEFDLEAPADENGVAGDGPGGPLADAEINGRLTMRDAILAKRGAGVQTWNAQGGNFATLLEVPILGASLPVARGWNAVDARVRGSGSFRFVNTHLEAFHPLIRQAQAGELVAPGGPATSNRPVILVGDLNSDDDTVAGPDRLAYETLLAAGMVSRSTNDPLSCCLNSSLLEVGKGGSVADFDHQVDHIMTRNPAQVKLVGAAITGLQPVNGFWSSDHAGVLSALRLSR